MSPKKTLQCWYFKKRKNINEPELKDYCMHPDHPNESKFTRVKCQGNPDSCDFNLSVK